MILASVKFKGFRRFLNPTTLKTTGKLTVLIGPNEAGKSSVIKLLSKLNDSEEFEEVDIYKFSETDEVEVGVTATYHLEPEDYDAIGDQTPRKYILTKRQDGSRIHHFEPKIERPKKHREAFVKQLKRVVKSTLFVQACSNLGHDVDELRKSANSLDISKETFVEQDLEFLATVKEICEAITPQKAPGYITSLSGDIDRFWQIEISEHPNLEALELIDARVPQFVEFTEQDRVLETSYNMTFFEHENPSNSKEPCNAFKNLCEISGLKLSQLKNNLTKNKPDQIQAQIDNANNRLEKLFNEAWSQSDIAISLKWHRPEIQIMVRMKADEKLQYNLINERSDGFRQYVALLAFMIREDLERPILLIDEAEQHLHYDAQADLIQTFTEKKLASQVIYSTHSAGCLPEDLGLGVKMVVPENDGSEFATSRIENSFWSTESLGFSPILYGMGAQTLAFFPTRKAVVAEGPSEMLLLPTIFRQITGLDHNGFQVVPGLANASKPDMANFASQGTHVVYLVDNDNAGLKYIEDLKKLNVSEDQLFKLSSNKSGAKTVEDWISDEVFSSAVNLYLARFAPEVDHPANGYFNGNGKAEKLKAFEKLHQVSVSKPALAYIVLENVESDYRFRIYNKKHEARIADLYKKITKVFDA